MSEKLNIDEQLARIDSNIELQETYVARAEALEKLMKMDEFHIVFTKGYIDEEANRIFNMLLSPRVYKTEEKEMYLAQLEAIKNLTRYIGDYEYKGTVATLGLNAKRIIADEKQLKQELIESKGA